MSEPAWLALTLESRLRVDRRRSLRLLAILENSRWEGFES